MPELGNDEDFTVILPTYNERDNIGEMIDTLRALYPASKVLVMDDDSPDGTGDLIETVYKDDVLVKVIVRKGLIRGLTASVVDGIVACDTRFFIVMDADFQHPPETLRGMMDKLYGGADLCTGVRRDRSPLGAKRAFFSWGAETLSHIYLRFNGKASTRDNMSGLFGGDAALVAVCLQANLDDLEIRGFKVLFDILKFLPEGSVIIEHEYDFGNRREGESKIGSNIILSILRQCGRPGRLAASVLASFP